MKVFTPRNLLKIAGTFKATGFRRTPALDKFLAKAFSLIDDDARPAETRIAAGQAVAAAFKAALSSGDRPLCRKEVIIPREYKPPRTPPDPGKAPKRATRRGRPRADRTEESTPDPDLPQNIDPEADYVSD
jgi:hypothetical protein